MLPQVVRKSGVYTMFAKVSKARRNYPVSHFTMQHRTSFWLICEMRTNCGCKNHTTLSTSP